MSFQRPRILIITGTLETSLHPVPPVADGAPEWNAFRLAEASTDLDVHVVSPCEARQVGALASFPAAGVYHHVVFRDAQLWLYRRLLRHFLPLRLAVRRLARLPDLMSWWYLRRAIPLTLRLAPEIVIINTRPQYIRYLRRTLRETKLLLFMRGQTGESRRFLPLLDGIIVNSEGMANYARGLLGSKRTPIWTMPNALGDEFKVPDAAPERFSRKDKRVVFAGRLIPEKGVLELLEAFDTVLKTAPAARLLICGAAANFKQDGRDSAYEREVRRHAALLPPESVRFEGWVPNTQMGSYYARACLAVFPSVCLESFGMVALEAMRCRTPVVASRRPGFEELVRHGETGLLVDEPSDAAALAKAMVSILSDPHLARQMGEAGYQRSLGYRPEAAIRRLETIVREALGRQEQEGAEHTS